ncbi:hypothetical protein DDT54_15060 [Brenneria nigrifluens DSM 30175 = ATCC 13028]|uniref:Uncharacterized protein n=1 Tax=Brenneria nigrifluens DSM 30175 = ATCC 13028 TaxID=1121120 RepID=A0A2U1UNW5_9GAMM|nr:hypothetical protein DDT54_15060 [Brenneria nigrifluens DSM 30175 = ATCC 13028]
MKTSKFIEKIRRITDLLMFCEPIFCGFVARYRKKRLAGKQAQKCRLVYQILFVLWGYKRNLIVNPRKIKIIFSTRIACGLSRSAIKNRRSDFKRRPATAQRVAGRDSPP